MDVKIPTFENMILEYDQQVLNLPRNIVGE